MSSQYLRPIRRGEYDLANISLIGHDPSSGRSYDDCHKEWRVELDKVHARADALKWWDLLGRIRLVLQISALHSHSGFG